MLIRAHRPVSQRAPTVVHDAEILEGYVEDASGAQPGVAAGLARPVDEAEASRLLRETLDPPVAVLFQAARTSLTGGAIPCRELVVSVEKMTGIGPVKRSGGGATVTVQPGVRLDVLRETLAREGWYYPPVPTYEQATIGGTVATNAGGAASFKYGVTRQWVRGLSVVLFNGDVLDLERGQAVVPRGAPFRLRLDDGTPVAVPSPVHRLPPLKKISAGYFSADTLDLVDLFVGSEGTLGLISSVTLDLVPLPQSVVTGLAFCGSMEAGLALASELRLAALRSRDRSDRRGPDVRAIESIDGHGLELLRSSGDARRLRVPIPPASRAALLFEMELAEATDNESAQQLALEIIEGRTATTDDGPIVRLFSILRRHGALDDLQFAFPEDVGRAAALKEFREAVPRRVNEILRERRRDQPEIKKIAGDLIVPFEHVAEMVRLYAERFVARGLEHAVWGHLSDGNLHPNALPRSAAEVVDGTRCVLEFADRAVELGGSPLSEHGVGRDPLKQRLLERFLGGEAIDGMRRVKSALDPPWRLAPGVLFAAPGRSPKLP